ncbi:MAG: ferredoxin [Ilumatobacteraceae bacterium]|nr:ferredoxin [Ilumatobacteraceae bacterium]
MIVSVDRDSCAATGGCAQLVPNVFSIGSDGIVEVLVTSPDESLRAVVLDAADLCPTAAIAVEG